MNTIKEIPVIKPIKVLRNEKGEKTEVILTYESYIELMERLQDVIDAELIDEVKDEPRYSWEEVQKMRETS